MHACAQPHVLHRSLAYTAACAALQLRGKREKCSASVVQLAVGPGTSADYQPGPLGGASPLLAVSVFVALCKRLPDGQVRPTYLKASVGTSESPDCRAPEVSATVRTASKVTEEVMMTAE